MSVEKNNLTTPDYNKNEWDYLHRKYSHISHEQVIYAVKSKGPNKEDIENYLYQMQQRKYVKLYPWLFKEESLGGNEAAVKTKSL